MENDEMPPIPDFLKRKGEYVLSDTPAPKVRGNEIIIPDTRPRLTNAYKDRVAIEIMAAIRDGATTKAGLRDALPHLQPRELSAGINQGRKNWMLSPKPKGQRPVHRRIKLVGQTYSVEIKGDC